MLSPLKCQVCCCTAVVAVWCISATWGCAGLGVLGGWSGAKGAWGSWAQGAAAGLRVPQPSSRHPVPAAPGEGLSVHGVRLLLRRRRHGVRERNEVVLITLNYYTLVKLF